MWFKKKIINNSLSKPVDSKFHKPGSGYVQLYKYSMYSVYIYSEMH